MDKTFNVFNYLSTFYICLSGVKKTPWSLYKNFETWWIVSEKTYNFKIQHICWYYLVNFYSVGTRITRILQTVLFYGILHLAALPSHRQIFHFCGSTMGLKAITFRLWSGNKSDAHFILCDSFGIITFFFKKIPVALFAERNKFLSPRSLFFVR
jgi:hypothetical protein